MTDPSNIVNILIVDDRSENLLALESILEAPDIRTVRATSGNEALAKMLEYDFALVLLDAQMPEMDGFETAKLMRARERTRDIPIIFVTAISKDERHVFEGYESGAVDYLFKPLDPTILKSKVKVFLDLYRQKKSLEQTAIELKCSIAELKNANRKILEQQKSVIEEERLKVLLQIAGATAHELNQPLMGILGNIELMELFHDIPEQLMKHLARIKEAGLRISAIVKKIHSIRYYETKPYLSDNAIINLDQKLRILSLENSDEVYAKIKEVLSHQQNVQLFRAKTIEDTLGLIEKESFDLLFIDYVLPDGNGIDFFRKMEALGQDIPVVVITSQGNEMIASQIIQAGAYDYLPVNKLSNQSLSRIISNTLEKNRLKREVNESLKAMAKMSTTDELTGLYNRRYFIEALEREVSRARRYGSELVLCLLDLDHFKKINDTHGHPAGDAILFKTGGLLKDWNRQSDLICRYGGEEFAVILPNTAPDMAVGVCERFRKMLRDYSFEFEGKSIRITVSIGIASFAAAAQKTSDALIAMADKALYNAKESGRDRVRVFQEPD